MAINVIPMLTKEQLFELLQNIESAQVERTISKTNTDKFGEAICSFSNDLSNTGLPGYLIVGADEDGSVANIDIDDRFLQTLSDFRTDGRIVPPPVIAVEKFEFEGGAVAVVEVIPSKTPPVRYKQRVCIRVGPRRGFASEAEERQLSEKRSFFARSFDVQPCFGSTLDDLSLEIFKAGYLPSAIDRETLIANGRDIKEQLASLKFYDLRSDCPTNAGIIMFGKNPRFFIPGSLIQYVRFKGLDESSDFEYEHGFDGDLTTQLRVVDEFIKSQITKRVQNVLGTNYVFAYPQSAIQELLYNAIVHKDYQSNAPIKFYEFSNRIEITNAGGLFGNARPENFPDVNDYRNPAIAEVVKNLGYINAFNVGVKRAKAALNSNGNPEPKFIIEHPTNFGVIIYKRQE